MAADQQKTAGLRERKKAKTMAAVQRHAMRLFRESGYHATTVEQIAEAAEISPSTFFRYFATKEDVVSSDNYDPILISAFEEQPADISPLRALRNAVMAGLSELSAEELETVWERNRLIVSVPELRASMLNNLSQTMQMITEMIAKRIDRKPDDLAVRTMSGAAIGVIISVLLNYAEHPEANLIQLMDEGLAQLEAGLPL
ncbi:acyl-CoA-like ligand-binding transcription factor [Paenibacillus nasutitermitis]|uniref:TetR family transcriptional regulator n=1 Tax=Paenibacillus nasutitermitis TaxID=1652958 RepID=A0A916ZGH9_9BACL|nr:TetR family transcriptional regulator [Paenibacillus nasutitermitis]GGD96242.1 TetR family transcriptional regulator [Paenibacillus nasutitermitis]